MDLLRAAFCRSSCSLESSSDMRDGTRGPSLRARVWPLVEGRASVRKILSSENNKKYTR